MLIRVLAMVVLAIFGLADTARAVPTLYFQFAHTQSAGAVSSGPGGAVMLNLQVDGATAAGAPMRNFVQVLSNSHAAGTSGGLLSIVGSADFPGATPDLAAGTELFTATLGPVSLTLMPSSSLYQLSFAIGGTVSPALQDFWGMAYPAWVGTGTLQGVAISGSPSEVFTSLAGSAFVGSIELNPGQLNIPEPQPLLLLVLSLMLLFRLWRRAA